MSNIDDTLWKHLVEHHGADRARVRSATAPRGRRRPVAAGVAVAGLAAAAVATIVITSPGSAPTAATGPRASRHSASVIPSGPARAQDTAYIVKRVKAKIAGDVVHTIGYSGGDATSDGSLVHLGEKLTDTYTYGAPHGFANVQRSVYYRAGRRVSGVVTRISPDGETQVSKVVNFTNRTYQTRRFSISGGVGPALAPGSPAQVRRALQNGQVTRQGTATIDGTRAIALLVKVKRSNSTAHKTRNGPAADLTLYVDAQTYEPLRLLSHESDGETGVFVSDWLPATRANMAKAQRGLVPAGYRKVASIDPPREQ